MVAREDLATPVVADVVVVEDVGVVVGAGAVVEEAEVGEVQVVDEVHGGVVEDIKSYFLDISLCKCILLITCTLTPLHCLRRVSRYATWMYIRKALVPYACQSK